MKAQVQIDTAGLLVWTAQRPWATIHHFLEIVDREDVSEYSAMYTFEYSEGIAHVDHYNHSAGFRA
jgi:hypothetical protein